jgi:hypothetical protein
MNSQQRRVIKRATVAWMTDRPHMAMDIMTDGGLRDMWPTFQAEQLRAARRRFLARMAQERAT